MNGGVRLLLFSVAVAMGTFCIAGVGGAAPEVIQESVVGAKGAEQFVLQLSDLPAGWKQREAGDELCFGMLDTSGAREAGRTALDCAGSATFQLSSSAIRVVSNSAAFGSASSAMDAFRVVSSRETANSLALLFTRGFNEHASQVRVRSVRRIPLEGGDAATLWAITVSFVFTEGRRAPQEVALIVRYAAMRQRDVVSLVLIAGNLPSSEANSILRRLSDRLEGKAIPPRSASTQPLPSKAEYRTWRDAFSLAMYGSDPNKVSTGFLFSLVNGQRKLITDLGAGNLTLNGAAERCRAILNMLERKRPEIARLPDGHPTLRVQTAQLLDAIDLAIRAFRTYIVGFDKDRESALQEGDRLWAKSQAAFQEFGSSTVRLGERVGLPG
jgi:hypothetical protein